MDAGTTKSKAKVAILAVVVGLVVVGGLIAYGSAGTGKVITGPSSPSPSGTATGNSHTYFNSSVHDGLQVQVALNATSMLSGEGLSAQVYLTNTLPRNVSLSANLTAFPGLSALEALGRGYACDGAGPFGLLNSGLYQGHYTSSNFSQMPAPAPLLPENPAAFNFGCPNPYYYSRSPELQTVGFAPNSDAATLSDVPTALSFANQTMEMHISFGTLNCTAVPYTSGPSTIIANGSTTTSSGETQLELAGAPYEGIRGYWTMPSSGSSILNDPHTNSTILEALQQAQGLYHQFRGSYTIVAEDYWNQTVFAYFDVRATPSLSTAGGTNTMVATVTATTTLMTQASQPTTSYAVPKSSICYFTNPTVTTTTTTTAWSTPPFSTTTTTVTTTSTIYLQTVTVTSCTESLATVTSTVTTTANP